MQPELALLLLALGLVLSRGQQPFGERITLDQSGRTVTVPVGTTILVELPSNPSTGFTWEITRPPDPAVLRLVSHRFQPEWSPAIGAGGTDLWYFRAVGAGTTTVRMRYARPWAPEDSPRHFSFTVRSR